MLQFRWVMYYMLREFLHSMVLLSVIYWSVLLGFWVNPFDFIVNYCLEELKTFYTQKLQSHSLYFCQVRSFIKGHTTEHNNALKRHKNKMNYRELIALHLYKGYNQNNTYTQNTIE